MNTIRSVAGLLAVASLVGAGCSSRVKNQARTGRPTVFEGARLITAV